jgi:hypothetical protein
LPPEAIIPNYCHFSLYFQNITFLGYIWIKEADMPNAAVITADIVNFSKTASSLQKKLLARLSLALQDQKFEFYRGDSFQVYMKDPQIALKTALEVRAIAREHSEIQDVRVSIGIGEVSVPVRSLHTTTGDAFLISGRAFDKLGPDDRLAIHSSNESANFALQTIGSFADYLAKNWTEKQAEVVVRLLNGESQDHIGKKLKKAQPTINKHAQAAAWPQVRRLLEEFKRVIIHFGLI